MTHSNEKVGLRYGVTHTASVRFLNPAGVGSFESYELRQTDHSGVPSLEESLNRACIPKLGEIATIQLFSTPFANITLGNEVMRGVFDKKLHRGLYLATMFREQSYSFASIEELLEAPELPVYTAEWLARLMEHAPINYKDDYGYQTLCQKPPFHNGDTLENRRGRISRLQEQLMRQYPHLIGRLLQRGMVSQSEIPYEHIVLPQVMC
jgi:hypothetical protein